MKVNEIHVAKYPLMSADSTAFHYWKDLYPISKQTKKKKGPFDRINILNLWEKKKSKEENSKEKNTEKIICLVSAISPISTKCYYKRERKKNTFKYISNIFKGKKK